MSRRGGSSDATVPNEYILGAKSDMTRQVLLIAATACVVAFNVAAEAAERFQRLTGPQIRARFSGIAMTDEVH